jgi:hypothetical protein
MVVCKFWWGLYCKQPFTYGHITCQKSLLQIYNIAKFLFTGKSGLLQKLTAAVYIKLHKHHNYPIKSDVTKMLYFNNFM